MANYDLETLRHSTAHLMAQAITRLYPNDNVELGIGPVIENGFYYDINMKTTILDEDLPKIQDMMKKLIKEKLPVERNAFANKAEAIEYFEKRNQKLKVELIQDMPEGEEITYYKQGDFIDLCRGPHVENTSNLSFHFKLMNTAGAYWRGDSDRQMLQRIYAVSFDSKEALKEHLHFLEEAKKRDHRKLGKELNLFHFETCTPGNPFFLPNGAHVYNSLIEFARKILRQYDYKEVLTPLVMDVDLWHTSGHYENYKENMYFTVVDEKEYAVKPMNCPGHMLMYKHDLKSHNDLPLRYAEFGRVHRYEKSGVMAGLTRVRSFIQDDAHIFCREDQVKEEISSLLDMYVATYRHFGFEKIRVNLSTRPEDKKIGSDEIWDLAEAALRETLEDSGLEYHIKEGDGAFYGPKIDFDIADALNRYHQLGTIQLDFMMPERFDLNYVNSSNERVRPVVIHRALLCSIERFFGIYLEHVAGAFPFWLAPVQAKIIPVKNELHLDYANRIAEELRGNGYLVEVDSRNESLGKKTRETQKAKVPFMLVIGDKEMEENLVNVRKYGQRDQNSMTFKELTQMFTDLNDKRYPEGLAHK